MSALVKNDVIKDKMRSFANMQGAVRTKMTLEVLSEANRELLTQIGNDEYLLYVEAFNAYGTLEAFTAFDDTIFEELTDAEKKLREIIHAEAFFALHYFGRYLKQLANNNVANDTIASGGNRIVASPYEDIVSQIDSYWEQAMTCLSFILPDDEDLVSSGSNGCFVV